MRVHATRHYPLAALVAGAGVAIAAMTWLLYRFDPNAAGSPVPPCLFYRLTGFYCPGCGITRALHALVHGDLARAWAMNPLLFVLLLGLPPLVLQAIGHQPLLPAHPRLTARVLDVLNSAKFWVGLLLAFWFLRNLPWWPFAWMAPG
jgi:hypothetical protein